MSRGWGSAFSLAGALHAGVLFVSFDFRGTAPQSAPAVAMRFSAAPAPEPSFEAAAAPAEPPPPPRRRRSRRPRPPKKRPAATAPRLAPVPESEPSKPSKVTPAALPPPKPQPAVRLDAYWRGFRSAVEAQKRYPRMARRLRLEGQVRIRVTIDRRGRLIGTPQIVQGSGHDVLDGEAVRMLKAADSGGFTMPLPEGWANATASVVLPFEFRLKS